MAGKPAAKKAAPRRRAAAKRQVRGSELGERGQRLWQSYELLVDGERGLVLLEEACRIVDRLGKLDELLRGDVDVWARVMHRTKTDDYELVIDSALIEARQQANTLRQILAGLPVKGASGDGDEDDWLDNL